VRSGLYIAPFGELADPRVLADLGAQAEARGFDGLFVWDHIARPHHPGLSVADPWIALAAVASRTRHLTIGPLVTPLARRRPHYLARQATTLDHLSSGRLVLGVGLGVNTGGELTRLGPRRAR
jgi:alkanesulfonate monooxygenase SsuD/methylene tetrahydromethanopterin reductase-like flavin-dependent oxidoreductase (luciferase family)